LANDSHYMNLDGSKQCSHCTRDAVESLEHYFLKCTTFAKQRKTLISNVSPLLKSLGLPLNVKSLLGFDDRLASASYRKISKTIRAMLYKHTCAFMRSTNRFKFVWLYFCDYSAWEVSPDILLEIWNNGHRLLDGCHTCNSISRMVLALCLWSSL